MTKKTAVITGASAGIGAATARRLAADGFEVVLGARRVDVLESLAAELGGSCFPLDVTDPSSVDAFCAQIQRCDVLINNAGGAVGLDPVVEAKDEDWLRMYELNVMSVMRMTRALISRLVESGDGHIVNIGSVSGRYLYEGGGGYTAAKHAERAVTQTLRGELFGKPVRVTEIQPGMVQTDFSLARFDGDEERANQVYAGAQPLFADDVADCIAWAVTRPSHVNVDEIMVTPRGQIFGIGGKVLRDGA